MVSSTREIKHFINGQFLGSKSGKTFNNMNPINGQIISKVHEGGSEEINHAVAAAKAAVAGEWGRNIHLGGHTPGPLRIFRPNHAGKTIWG